MGASQPALFIARDMSEIPVTAVYENRKTGLDARESINIALGSHVCTSHNT